MSDHGSGEDVALPLDPDIEAPAIGHPTRPTPSHALAVFAGGCIGTLLRYGVTQELHQSPHAFPWTIVTINAIGALLLGILGGSLFITRPESVTLRLFLGAGILGGWTTYSAIVVGLLTFAHFGHWVLLVVNMIAAVLLPFAGASIGLVVGNSIVRMGRS
jgi:CrcB protein